MQWHAQRTYSVAVAYLKSKRNILNIIYMLIYISHDWSETHSVLVSCFPMFSYSGWAWPIYCFSPCGVRRTDSQARGWGCCELLKDFIRMFRYFFVSLRVFFFVSLFAKHEPKLVWKQHFRGILLKKTSEQKIWFSSIFPNRGKALGSRPARWNWSGSRTPTGPNQGGAVTRFPRVNRADSRLEAQALRKEATQLKSELETTEVPWNPVKFCSLVEWQIWFGKSMLNLYNGMSLCRNHYCMMHMISCKVTSKWCALCRMFTFLKAIPATISISRLVIGRRNAKDFRTRWSGTGMDAWVLHSLKYQNHSILT